MKRVVTGPNGILTVFGNEHLSNDNLIVLAKQLTAEKDALIETGRRMLYATASPKPPEAKRRT